MADQIGIQVHRISLEWARIEPEEGKFDLDAVKKYKEIFLYMRKVGIEPMVCLNHFSNPQWFTAQGGWKNNKAPHYYQRYAEFLAKKLGVPLNIKWWLTFNEPQFTIMVPYGNGSWPPFDGVKNLQDKEGFARIMRVASNVLDGHRLAYRAIHKVMDRKLPKDDKIMVSFASAPGAFYPYDEDSSLDKLADNAFNLIYTLSLDSFVGNTDRDFIGLNYYGRTRLKLYVSIKNYVLSWLTEERPFAIDWITPDEIKQGNRPREFYPQGLYDLIMKFRDYGLPIVITENGLNDSSDNFREEFIVVHLKAVFDAIKDGANVIGYQYWSLADTWEPGDASFSNFGLISIDRNKNLERKLRPSASVYKEIIETRKIRKYFLEKYDELLEIKRQPEIILKYDSQVENNLCHAGNKFNKGLVSLTFDDGWKEIYQNAIPLLDKAGIKSTQYVSTGVIEENNKKYVSAKELLIMERAGHEIGSHAVDHKRFTEIGESDIKSQLTGSKINLLKMGVKAVNTFAYPYGEYTDYSVSISRRPNHVEGYIGVRTAIPGMNDTHTDRFLLYGYQLEKWMTFSPHIKRLIDRAIAENKWLILIFHQVSDENYQYYTSIEDLRLLVNSLVESKVPVMTVRDVIKKCYKN